MGLIKSKKADNFMRTEAQTTTKINILNLNKKAEINDVFKIKTGKTLKAIREKNHQSQRIVAYLLGKDQSQISRIERGLEDIRFSEFDKFCRHFDVSPLDVIAEIKHSES